MQSVSMTGALTGLAMVATPIGNLRDLSPRAREVLSSASLILAEDTRELGHLLRCLGIEVRGAIQRLDHHASPKRLEDVCHLVCQLIEEQKLVAYCSDAGTPGISDPGARLVAEVRKAGANIFPVPGPSSVSALVSVCGWEEARWGFLGFLPRRDKELTEWFDQVRELTKTAGPSFWVALESPERILETLETWSRHVAASSSQKIPEEPLGQEESVEVILAKELTKKHERIWQGPLDGAVQWMRSLTDAEGKGEWILALKFHIFDRKNMGSGVQQGLERSKCLSPVEVLSALVHAGVGSAVSAKIASQLFDISRSDAYQWVLNQKEPK